MLRRALLDIYARRSNPSDISPHLFRELLGILDQAVDKGLGDTSVVDPHDDFRHSLSHSNAVFSAFKVHRMQRDMARLLTDADGNLKSFRQWTDDVSSITSHQVGSWLRTEYDTAVQRAHAAADWLQFQREKDILPNLRWEPSTSITPGEDHRPFWNLILPVDDPFWDHHRPGDRWNCKCSLSSTDEPSSRRPILSASPADNPQSGLRDNPAKSRSVFSDDHPYFPDDCSSCPFAGGFSNSFMRFFDARRKKDCYKCRSIDRRLKKLSDPIYLAKSEYYDLKHNPLYRDVRFDKKSGGIRATHVGHNDRTGRKEFFGGTMSGADLERACVEQLFRAAHKVILCDESKMKNRGEAYSALDMELDGRMMDIRSITGRNRWYTHALLTKNRQLKKYNARPDITQKADALCLYFHDATLFNEDRMFRSINKYKHFYGNNGRHVTPLIKKLYVVVNGSKEILIFDI